MACPDPKDSLEVCFLDGRRQVGVRFTKNSAQSRGQEGAVGSSPPAEKDGSRPGFRGCSAAGAHRARIVRGMYHNLFVGGKKAVATGKNIRRGPNTRAWRGHNKSGEEVRSLGTDEGHAGMPLEYVCLSA